MPEMSYRCAILWVMVKHTKYDIPTQVTLTVREHSENPEDQVVPPIASAMIQFLDGESIINLGGFTRLNSDSTATLSDQMTSISDFQNLHTVLSRRSANHPSRFGLEARPLPGGHIGLKPISAEEASGGGRRNHYWARNSFSAPDLNLELLPAELHDEHHGWFAPGSDLAAFGTLYLVPTGTLLEESWANRDQIKTFGWALAQVGIEGFLALADWDDKSAVETLAKRVLTDDVEIVTTMRALSDSSGVADGLKRHRYRQALRDAREHFPAYSLRPRLVPTIVTEALRAHSLEESHSYSRDEGIVRGMVTLDDYAVYGWRNQPKPIAAGYVVEFKEQPAENKFIEFATDLASRLAARKLGSVLVLPGDLNRVWVTRNLELTKRFSNVFGAQEEALFVPLATWLDARTGVSA